MENKTICKILVVSIALVIVVSGVALGANARASDSTVSISSSTIHVPDNYPTIQEAVNKVPVGGTIIVREEIYTESVHVNKRLTIKSEKGADKTTVHAFEVTSAYVKIIGFTVKGSTSKRGIYLINAEHCDILDNVISDAYKGIELNASSNNNITNNIVSGNHHGIYLSSSSNNNKLLNNTASNNDNQGITIESSSNNKIRDNNTVSNNWIGTVLEGSSNNRVVGNNVSGNKHHNLRVSNSNSNNVTNNIASNSGLGIYLRYSSSNNITDNTCLNNGWKGIRLLYSSNNRLISNNVSNGREEGIYLDSYSSNNWLISNDALNNHNHGIFLDFSSSSNRIINNTADSNHYQGIHLESSSNNITGNKVSNNPWGIVLYSSNSKKNRLSNNTVWNNTRGICIGYSSNNTLIKNNVSDNADFGIYLESANNNTIYNNYFNNTNNSYDNGKNTWNITKTAGTNIVGGPYLGGNYWSDYGGADLDGDKLGDTLLPYNCSGRIQNGGDYHPLIKIEKIILKASKEGFLPQEKVLDNSENSRTIRIFGTVEVSFISPTPLEGAKVEILEGATPTYTFTDHSGFYEITAEVPDGKGEREVSNFNFTLEPEYFIITVTAKPAELPADGLSTTQIEAKATGREGEPLEDRPISFKQDCPDGQGTLKVTQGTTDSNGIAKAIYTSFKPDECQVLPGLRSKVTITATETIHGEEGTEFLYVTQNKLYAWNNAYIPADPNCKFPSELHITLEDYHNNPIAGAPIKVRLEGENAVDGTVVPVAYSTDVNSEITVYTDSKGEVKAYYRWTGSPILRSEVVKTVKIIDEQTNVCVPEKRIHIGLDLAITGIEPIGFGGVTGTNAFFRIYIADRLHPGLDLDEFNMGDFSKLQLRLRITQYAPDFPVWNCDEIAGWAKDGVGRTYVQRLAPPLTPYVVPLSDGGNWWQICVLPLNSKGTEIKDCFPPNNCVPVTVISGSPGDLKDFFHIWLTEGVLTPHNHLGVVVKCVARFVPGVGTTIKIIDILNSAYKKDVFDLSRRMAVGHWKELQIKLMDTGKVLKVHVAKIDTLIRCLEDFRRVAKEGGRWVPYYSSGSCGCCQHVEISLVPRDNSFEQLDGLTDKLVHGMIMAIPEDVPERRGVIVFDQTIDSVSLNDSGGEPVDDPEMMSSEGGVVVYIVPANETYSLEISTDSPFRVAVYEAGSDEFNRNTYRHEVETAEYLKANMCISNSSDYSLNIDLGGDGSIDEVVNPRETILDIEKPTLSNLQPPDGATVSTSTPAISADYADNSGGCGIDIATASIAVDDVDCTEDAMVTASGISYTPDCLVGGQHNVTVGVSDNDGNYASIEWSFESITSGAKTIYVDDDFTDDPANHKWDTIQEGITDATDGDTVLVYTGTYTETVVLNKRLTLTGEGMPKIDAQSLGDAINITADNCTVKGFNCVNAQPSPYAGIRADSSNNVIADNTCNDNYEGIYLLGSSNEIRNNIAKNNQHYGIRLQASDDNIITDNTAKGNGASGIRLKASDYNRIMDNDASNSVNYHGISVSSSNNNEIRNNVANSNHQVGIGLWSSCDNIIAKNTAKGNGNHGIYLKESNANRITDNDVSNNVKYHGISLKLSNNNVILSNTANTNGEDGIYLNLSNDNKITGNAASNSVDYHGISLKSSNNNEVRNNVADSNHYDGIKLRNSTDNIMSNNTVKNNEDDGISLTNSNNNKIYMNNFMDNGNNVYSEDSTNIWHSPSELDYIFKGNTYTNYLGNYWDDYTGSDTDNDGIGDSHYIINSDKDIYPLKEPRENYFVAPETNFDTGESANQYPSIMGTHTGTIKANQPITITKLYTYSCPETGGHTEYIWVHGNGVDASAAWNGYQSTSDYHLIEFAAPVTLEEGVTYDYTIRTGSYPQIHHTNAVETATGWLNCTAFEDKNGKVYYDRIPAVKFFY